MTGQNRRIARVNESIRESLSMLIRKNIDDPKLAWVTITGVETTPDLRNARAFFVVSAGDTPPEVAEKNLNRAAPHLQSVLGKTLKLKFTPKLAFKFDSSLDDAAHIDRLIYEVQEERTRRPSETPEQTLGRLVSDAESILVMAHRNPDGDAVGSLLGLGRILRLHGKKPWVYCPDGIPETFSYLADLDEVQDRLPSEPAFDLTICLDTADKGLLPTDLPDESALGKVVVIDHHATHGEFGDLVIRREASSVGEILLDLQKTLVWPLDREVAECFYTSIVADTGSFRYSNTTAKTHRAAAELIAAGARSWVVATALFESYPLSRQRLLASVLNTLEVTEQGRFAALYCTPEMLAAAGATKEDLDNVINFGRAVNTVEIAALCRLEPTGEVKVSFRSKGNFDVAALASRFGGGGHKNAAGCTLRDVTLDVARRQIADAVAERFAG